MQKLSEAMKLGRLGEQIVLKSRAAFQKIKYVGNEQAKAEEYFIKKMNRDREARREYRKARSKASYTNELFMIDILREGIENNDPRLR